MLLKAEGHFIEHSLLFFDVVRDTAGTDQVDIFHQDRGNFFLVEQAGLGQTNTDHHSRSVTGAQRASGTERFSPALFLQ